MWAAWPTRVRWNDCALKEGPYKVDHLRKSLAFTSGRSGRQAQTPTRIAFFIAGFGMAAWAPQVPFVQTRAALLEGARGLLLLCLGGESMVAMPLAGFVCSRFGCRRVIVAATAVIWLALPTLAVAVKRPGNGNVYRRTIGTPFWLGLCRLP